MPHHDVALTEAQPVALTDGSTGPGAVFAVFFDAHHGEVLLGLAHTVSGAKAIADRDEYRVDTEPLTWHNDGPADFHTNPGTGSSGAYTIRSLRVHD